TAIKVGAILIMSAFLLGKGSGLSEVAPPGAPHGVELLTAMGAAMIGVLWAYEGWQYVTFSAGEVIEPQRTFARSLVVGTALLIVLYLLANFAYVAALGVTRSMTSERI